MAIQNTRKLVLTTLGLAALAAFIPCAVSASPGGAAAVSPAASSADDQELHGEVAPLIGTDAVPCGDDAEDGGPVEEARDGLKFNVDCGTYKGGQIKSLPVPVEEVNMVVAVADYCTGKDSWVLYYESSNLKTPAKRCKVPDSSSKECSFNVKVGDMYRVVCLGDGGSVCDASMKLRQIK